MTGDSGEETELGRRRYRMAAYTTMASVASKALTLLVLFISVPLTISYLGPHRFGVWMTLASLIGFLGFLDFGIGSSLVNEVAHYKLKESRERLTRLITHALLLLATMGLMIAGLLIAAARTADLEWLFNATGHIDPSELRASAYVLAILIGASLPIVGLQRIFLGLQRGFIYYLLAALGSLTSLSLLYYFSQREAGIPVLLLATYGMDLVATLPLLGILAARKLVGRFDLSECWSDSKALMSHGSFYFILSIGGAAAWNSDFIIITSVNGAAALAAYAVSVRLFQLVETPLQMINTPLWSAYADAKVHGNSLFIRQTLKRSFWLSFAAATVGCGLVAVLHEFIIRAWIREAVVLPWTLVATMAVWCIVRATGNAFGMYLNGMRIVLPQVVAVATFCILALPLKIYGAYHLGALGVVFASLVGYFACAAIPYLTVFRKQWLAPLQGAG